MKLLYKSLAVLSCAALTVSPMVTTASAKGFENWGRGSAIVTGSGCGTTGRGTAKGTDCTADGNCSLPISVSDIVADYLNQCGQTLPSFSCPDGSGFLGCNNNNNKVTLPSWWTNSNCGASSTPSCKPSTPSSKPSTPSSKPSTPSESSSSSSSSTPSKPSSKPSTPSSSSSSSSSKPTTPGGGSDVDLGDFAQEVVRLVNAERAAAGLPALKVDTKVQAAAQVRAKEQQTSFSHTRPNGSKFSTALTEAGVSYSSAGENIAWGQRTPAQVMDDWMNSSGHRANILGQSYGHIGVGFYQDANGTTYWAQLFTN